MLKNAVIIIPNISSEEQVCDFLWQTKNCLAKNNDVFVINYYNPINLIPFSRYKIIDQLNKAIYFLYLQFYLTIKFFKKGRKYYFWMFFPQLVTAIKFKLPWWQAIFDVVDYHDSPILVEHKLLQMQKKYLLSKADYVFSISKTLKKLYQKDAKTEIRVVPQGFDLASFTLDRKKSALNLPKVRPVIGFVGQMSQRLDFDLLLELIANNQQWNFIFVGPKHHESNVSFEGEETKINQLFFHKNFFHIDKQPRQEMFDIIEQFDVCIIPYNDRYLFNRYCYPMKTFEYFYAGKPVISTEIEELKKFPEFISIAKTAAEFSKAINAFLNRPLTIEQQLFQKKIANANTWKMKIDEISKNLLDQK